MFAPIVAQKWALFAYNERSRKRLAKIGGMKYIFQMHGNVNLIAIVRIPCSDCLMRSTLPSIYFAACITLHEPAARVPIIYDVYRE